MNLSGVKGSGLGPHNLSQPIHPPSPLFSGLSFPLDPLTLGPPFLFLKIFFKKEENKRGEYCERQQQLHTAVSSLDTRARARLRGGCAGVPPLRLLICRLKGAFASAVDNLNRGFGKAAISSVENLKQRTGTRRAADPIVITCDPGSFQLTRITCDQGVTKRGHHHSMKWSRG